MKSIIAVTAALFLMTAAPPAFAENNCDIADAQISFEMLPEKCRAELDTWAMAQPDTSIDFEGDIVVGTVLPETVTFVEVPVYKRYGYVVVNKRRVLIDRDNRTIVKVYG